MKKQLRSASLMYHATVEQEISILELVLYTGPVRPLAFPYLLIFTDVLLVFDENLMIDHSTARMMSSCGKHVYMSLMSAVVPTISTPCPAAIGCEDIVVPISSSRLRTLVVFHRVKLVDSSCCRIKLKACAILLS